MRGRQRDGDATHECWLSLGDMNGNPDLVLASGGYDVPGGTVTHALSADESTTLTWTAMAAKHPPNTDPCPEPADPSGPPICVAPGR
jgi:hypothetical protein